MYHYGYSKYFLTSIAKFFIELHYKIFIFMI